MPRVEVWFEYGSWKIETPVENTVCPRRAI
jgi:hypothetical protein